MSLSAAARTSLISGDGRLAQARHFAQQLFRRVHGFGEAAEAGEDRLGQ
jgi:hypothetical protein